jgi:hypothetical protein
MSAPEETNPLRSIIMWQALTVLLAVLPELSPAQTPDPLNESLKRSQFCARAAKEFFERPEWKSAQPGHAQGYTSHFNKGLNKCLVNVRTMQIVAKSHEVLEMNHIYHALEGRVLGGKILTKKIVGGGEEKVVSITLVKDGKFIRDASEAATVLTWFDRLMEDRADRR